MGEPKAPGGTQPIPDSPELTYLKEREAAQKSEVDRLEKMDANKMNKDGHDFFEVKRRAAVHLSELRKAIQELTK